ncbi:prolyl oligopeptidase family serine peptidase [Shewanella avicenniae]|uniref:Prolyl oligopeptidase family serine peptidase n=1 Tax=Shewanella avicenniae TaxID=2814294 RepID=A0ABX7QL87_9GAMM|nr:prolyl oligopeptidase family serine peptidase [Shewanella avicenniae]QSX32217.1 prolyl oligopeptidase family serine peptidase [Shewanella avicenniae]
MNKQVVVLLHGVGSNGANMASLAQQWQTKFPDVIWLSPNAPFASDMGNGYQWFSLKGVTDANRPERIQAARAALDSLLAQLFHAHDIDPNRDNVIFVGFSQGSMMSLDMLVSARMKLAGVIAFSGRLASPQPYQFTQNVPVLLVHGLSDPAIHYSESEKSASALSALGHSVQTQFEAGLNHAISAQGAAAAAEFIKAQLS